MMVVPGGEHVLIRPDIGEQVTNLLIAALAATDHGVMITDLHHTTLACNERFGEIWNIDPSVVVLNDSKSVRRMVADRIPNLAQWEENLQEVYANDRHIQDDKLELIEPKRVVRRYTGPVWDESGKSVARIWTFLDITEEERRRKRSQLLQDTSLLSDPDPKKVYKQLVNEVASFYDSMCFLSIRSDDYMEFRAIGAPPGNPALEMKGNRSTDAYCQFCLAEGPIIIQDARQDDRYRELLPFQVGLTRYAGTPIHSPNGEVIGTLCILDSNSSEILETDDLNLLRLVAMRISSELERERYISGLETDLEEAQARAIRNEKLAVTGTLSAAVAHDIRNILTAMKLDLDAGPDAIEKHIDRFSLLAHRLLSYAKPSRVMKASVDLHDSLHRVLSLLEPHASIAKIKVEAEVPSDLPPVLADPARLDHLFVNLILNAVQAMGRSGVLRVKVKADGKGVTTSISDSGPGLSEDQVEKLFEPFASTRQDGFGLGLYSAQQIAKECEGQITVQSTLGEGATFHVWLPKA
ncbi:MAG: GAF domain-containing protein [Fimbriimonadaceae bacterium]|nr:GAF domain-containing protein [Fimbriimonadaceae bacterium]